MQNIKLKTVTETIEGESFVNIILDGGLNIVDCVEAKQKIQEILSKNDFVKISANSVTSMDLSFVQMFVSLIEKNVDTNKKILLACNLPDDMKLLLEHAGIDRLLSECVN